MPLNSSSAGRLFSARLADLYWKNAATEPPATVVSITDYTLAQIAVALKSSLNAAGVAIALESEGVIVCRAAAGNAAPDVGTHLTRGEGITWECISTGAETLCPDIDNDPRVNAGICRQLGIGSLLLMPVQRRGEVVGVVVAMFAAAGEFSAGAIESVRTAAEQVGLRVYDDGGAHAESDQSEQQSWSAAATIEGLEQTLTASDKIIVPVVTPAAAQNPSSLSAHETVGTLPTIADTAAPVRAGESAYVAEHNQLLTSLSSPARVRSRQYSFNIPIVTVCLALIVAGFVLNYWTPRAAHRPQAASSSRADSLMSPQDIPATSDLAAEGQLERPSNEYSSEYMNAAEAAQRLRESAERGSVDAQFEFGQALEFGRGLAADAVQACTWYLVSTLGGSAQGEEAYRRLTPQLSESQIGQIRLGVGELYAKGGAVPRSVVAAYRWFFLADAAGNREARSAMARLATEMTPKEITQATEQGRAWLNRHRIPINDGQGSK